MNLMVEGMIVAIIPMGVLYLAICFAALVEHIEELVLGSAELPKILRKKKNPRRVAARRGEVGRKIRRTKYEYIEIIPDFGGSVKRLRVRRVWR